MGPVTREELQRVEASLGGRIEAERRERVEAVAGIESRVMTSVQALHAQNLGRLDSIGDTTQKTAQDVAGLSEFKRSSETWQQSMSTKVDMVLRSTAKSEGVVTGATGVGDRVGTIAGWVLSALLAAVMAYWKLHG